MYLGYKYKSGNYHAHCISTDVDSKAGNSVLTNLFPVGWRVGVKCGSGCGSWTWSFHISGEVPGTQSTGAEHYSEDIGDPWRTVRLELNGESHCGLERVDFCLGKGAQAPGLSSERPLEGKGKP